MLENMTQKEFDKYFIKIHETIIKDPLNNFVRAKGFVNTNPAPGQRVLLKLVFGQKLDSETKYKVYSETKGLDNRFKLIEEYKTEVELYEFMTDKVYDFEKVCKITDISLIVGRRGGKTLISSILAIYSTLKIDWKPLLGKHNTATILIASHTKDFSDEIIDVMRSLIEESPILSRLIDKSKKNTQSTINLKIPFYNEETKRIRYSRVRLRTNAASSKSSRGSACPVIILDEIAFFGSDINAKETDEEIVRAIKPSMLQFSKQAMMIKLSSPNIKQGILYETYKKRAELPDDYLILKAPSWVFNNRLPKEEFEKEEKVDPENFNREFRANFTDSISTFIMPEAIDRAVQKGVKFIPPEDKTVDITYHAAIDAAFKSDRFTFSLVGAKEGRITQYLVHAWEGSKTKPIEAHEIAKFLSQVVKEFGLNKIFADQFAFQPLKEIFAKFNVVLEEMTFTNTYKKKIYYNLKNLIHSNTLDLLDHEMTQTELKQLQVEQSSTGTIKIGHPVGGHDDFADSLAVSCYEAMEGKAMTEFGIAGLENEESKVRVDATGRAIDAPTAEMVAQVQGVGFIDNTGEYYKDENGKWQKSEENDDDEIDDGGFAFA